MFLPAVPIVDVSVLYPSGALTPDPFVVRDVVLGGGVFTSAFPLTVKLARFALV